MQGIVTRQGRVALEQLETPTVREGHILVRTEFSAISPGTELSIVKRAPEQSVNLGYSAVGIVERVGEGADAGLLGKRVACYGAPYVHHAERLAVPTNLTALVPDSVAAEEAAFGGLGAIAVHALRVARLSFGESVAVVGLGILGNLIAQIAHAAAYRTFGIDLDRARVEQLKRLGVKTVYEEEARLEEAMTALTGGGIGVDAVIVCASGPGERLLNKALQWIRPQGKVVVVGDVTMEFSRELLFAKEAQMLISRAGGPGRYDAAYERDNCDYPIGYVRWTEGRNLGEYIRLLSEGRITTKPLVTGIYPLAQAPEAYAGSPGALATLISY